jgi:hypothetical protein
MTEDATTETEEIWEPCSECGGTGRTDPAPVMGLRTQGATMDSKVTCPVCRGAKGRMVTRRRSAEE